MFSSQVYTIVDAIHGTSSTSLPYSNLSASVTLILYGAGGSECGDCNVNNTATMWFVLVRDTGRGEMGAGVLVSGPA